MNRKTGRSDTRARRVRQPAARAEGSDSTPSKTPCVCPCVPLCAAVCAQTGLGGVPAPTRGFWAVLPPFGGGYEDTRAPAEAQRSGFGGKRRSCGMSDFPPFWAEMRDMEPATTTSRIKPWRRFRRYGWSHLPAVRAVCGGLQAVSGAPFVASVSDSLFTSGV